MLSRLFIPFLCFILSGCGIAQYNSDKKLTPEQIADLTDEELCKKVNFQMAIGDYVPVKYMREAQKRNLEYCADK